MPWRTRPLIDDPADAAALAHWYQRNGWAQTWPPLTPPTSNSDAGSPESSYDPVAVSFWIPTEYCTGFADARPLPHDTPLRLPFPIIFACFAQPWTLPAHPDHTHADLPSRYPGMLHARGPSHTERPPTLADVLQRLQPLTRDRTHLPTPLQVVSHLGGRVDGLILTTHPDGTPTDTFAWCLAVPHPWATTLTRVLIPASRATTTWHSPVDNMIAAIALSSWHPTNPTTGPAGPTVPGQRAHAGQVAKPLQPPQVRVLDIDTTTTARTPPTAASATAARQPHLRRGHWRRQRVGHARRDQRWVWVRPTTVNPGQMLTTQIYRLPAPTPAG